MDLRVPQDNGQNSLLVTEPFKPYRRPLVNRNVTFCVWRQDYGLTTELHIHYELED